MRDFTTEITEHTEHTENGRNRGRTRGGDPTILPKVVLCGLCALCGEYVPYFPTFTVSMAMSSSPSLSTTTFFVTLSRGVPHFSYTLA